MMEVEQLKEAVESQQGGIATLVQSGPVWENFASQKVGKASYTLYTFSTLPGPLSLHIKLAARNPLLKQSGRLSSPSTNLGEKVKLGRYPKIEKAASYNEKEKGAPWGAFHKLP